MSSSRRSTQPSMSPAEQVAAYVDRKFGTANGIVVMALGSGSRFGPNDGSYKAGAWT